MKYRTTQKEIKSEYAKIIKICYCDIQTLLTYAHPIAYTCGTYGWNADIYDINGIAVVTGYRPFGNISPKYEKIREYELKAKSIYKSLSYDERKTAMDNLLNVFIEEIAGD